MAAAASESPIQALEDRLAKVEAELMLLKATPPAAAPAAEAVPSILAGGLLRSHRHGLISAAR
jgi:hypothetical protein